jgi:ribosomal protein S18 acetylase RimI-like enzyme
MAGAAGAVNVRRATAADDAAIWRVLEPAFRAGDTYAIDPAVDRAAALAYWAGGAGEETFVAEADGGVVGTYGLRPNRGGGGAHVANASFVVHPAAAGRGVASAMARHALARAAARGFAAMQFNFVVSSNTRAVALWRRLGFDVVGTLPGAFRHPTLGEVDAYVMFRRL